MYTRLTAAVGSALLGAAFLIGTTTPAVASEAQVSGLNATIKLNGCSASLVRYPTSSDTDFAMMLTNGHCYEDGMPQAGEVLVNEPTNTYGDLLNDSGEVVATVNADLLLYATMTGTDVALFRLTETFGEIQRDYGITALTLSDTRPAKGAKVNVPSAYWSQVQNCKIDGFVRTVREDQWTWQDSIRFTSGCKIIHGSSGSPIVDSATRKVIGVNNTNNDEGGSCTMNNPCEVDDSGTVTKRRGQGYGQQTYWFTTCLTSDNAIDLTIEKCLLTRP